MPLPAPQPSFVKKKAAILAQLSVPASEYTDSSPKGSVDEGIRELIDEINAHEGFVTTSSCAGRVSVFVEGRKAARLPAASGIPGLGPDSDDRPGAAVKQGVSDKPASSTGGKGGGGSWLFVSHEPISVGLGPEGGKDVVRQLGLEFSEDSAQDLGTNNGEPPRLIHFKFEPMILHVLTSSPSHAEVVLKCGLQAGYRESGAINLLAGKQDSGCADPIVAVRSMGLSIESLIGIEKDGRRRAIVSSEYLRMLVGIANNRFEENLKRIARFRESLRVTIEQEVAGSRREKGAAREARRENKMAEGLKRRDELRKERETQGARAEEDGLADLDIP